jgi:hypothetical protein
MNCNSTKIRPGQRMRATVLTITGALVLLAGSTALAQPPAAAIQGTWGVLVTLRNCATNAPLGPPFNSLVTFAEGGTISESPGGAAFAPDQRSAGHGVWAHQGGVTFSQRMIALLRFATPPNFPVSPGFQAGWQIITHTVTMSDADHFTSAGNGREYDLNRQLVRTGCSTAVGERFN